MKKLQFFQTSHRHVTEDYPYGFRLRTTKVDWVEFKPSHGFRHVSQTINPKTGRPNKPKAGTYYPCMLMGINPENDHVETAVCDFYGLSGINAGCKWLHRHGHYFTNPERRHIFGEIAVRLRAEIQATATYCGADVDNLLPLFDAAMKAAIEGYQTGAAGNFDLISIDVDAVKALHVEGFNPFKIVRH